MFRSVGSKVAWVGRTASMVFGLALVLVVGVATMAFGDNGDFFKVGRANFASAVSTLTKSGLGPALSLRVDSGPPLAVNSGGKVANLNADRLDNMDSRAFGIQMLNSQGDTGSANCGQADVWTECAPVTVKVPAGKEYFVSAWSDFTLQGGQNNRNVAYCSAIRRPGDTEPMCLSDNPWRFGVPHIFTNWAHGHNPASASGEFGPLSAGTYTFSTAIKPQTEAVPVGIGTLAITKVMVRDASVPRPPIN